MATSLDILVRAHDAASGVINNVRSSGQKLDSTLSSTSKTTGKLGGMFASGAAKLGGLLGVAYGAKQAFDFGADAIKNAEDAQRSMDAFTDSLKRTGQSADINEDKFNSWLQSMGESIGQDDEDLRDLATSLTSAFDFSKLKGDATQNLMLMSRSIQDVSAATQKSSGLVKRAFLTLANDPAGAVTQFQKLGVITEDQADHFKAMAEKGRDAAVTQQILTLTGKRYGGAAAANTTASDKLATVWENMKEALGNFLLPAFEKLVDWISQGVSAFRNLVSGGDGASKTLGGLGNILSQVWNALKPVIQAWGTMLVNAWNALVQVYKTNLQPALLQLWKVLQPVVMVALKAYAAFYAIAAKVFPILIKVLGVVLGILIKLAAFIIGVLVKAITVIGGVFKTVGSIAKSVWSGITSVVRGAWNLIKSAWNGAKSFFTGIWDGVKSAASTAFGYVRSFWNSTVGGFGFTIPDWVPLVGGKEFRIPMMAAGGLVSRPTLAMIGEAGPEAVIPLSKLEAMGGTGAPSRIDVRIGRRHFVDESDFEAKYAGF